MSSRHARREQTSSPSLGDRAAAFVVGLARRRNWLAGLVRLLRSLRSGSVDTASGVATDPVYYRQLLGVHGVVANHPPLPLDARFERMPEDEPAQAREIARLTASSIIKNYCAELANDRLAIARRDVHVKQTGFLHAHFTVRQDLPPPFAVGAFRPGARYDACLRFSNSQSSVNSDRRPDARGLSIKLKLGAPRPSILAPEVVDEQDFVLSNHPVFFLRNAADYVILQRFIAAKKEFSLDFLHETATFGRYVWHHPRLLWTFLRIAAHRVHNPLDVTYHSMSPYRLGSDTVVRYIVRPRKPAEMAPANFLHDRMAQRLAPVVFDFLVQVRAGATPDDVENANKIWVCDNDREEPIGMIEIPPQDISSPGTQYHGETLSFSPWNCLKDHRPLGGLNRVRLMVYRTSKDVRHRLNGIR